MRQTGRERQRQRDRQRSAICLSVSLPVCQENRYRVRQPERQAQVHTGGGGEITLFKTTRFPPLQMISQKPHPSSPSVSTSHPQPHTFLPPSPPSTFFFFFFLKLASSLFHLPILVGTTHVETDVNLDHQKPQGFGSFYRTQSYYKLPFESYQ